MTHYIALVQDNLAKLGEWVVENTRIENLNVDVLVGIVAILLIKEAMLLPIYL